MEHPLDRPVWSALTGPQAGVAVRAGAAVRYHPDVGLFAATADAGADSMADLAGLVRAHGETALVESRAVAAPPGLAVVSEAACLQMVAAETEAGGGPVRADIATLSPTDWPEMAALAQATRPGPFFARTPGLGRFLGVRIDGRLAAMAGERMRIPGFTEVSGVCTLPPFRGQGLAADLIRAVMAAMRARGETPMLHTYASNTGANRLYEALGFRVRRELVMTTLSAPQPGAELVRGGG
ncbi:GNAT family N-acetyltransferase [Phenylobacterium sp.]|uniref:GNAT family N-acetyltransferase n=1 Tax=Phenylobacterium sp. TaxID=1871053 RepID=UPI00301C89CB